MSILSTNHRLISIGESYSAGNGIDITDQVISVTGDATPYSAGENIDIQDHIISGKDWSNDITEASSHAYNETTAWVKENYTNSADMTYISAVVDTKLDASAWSSVSGDFATESYVIMSDNITYDRAKGYVDSQQFAKESACQSAFDYLNTNKLDNISFTNWQNGQYTTDLQTIEGQISNKYDTSSFAEVSGSFQPSGDYAKRDFVLSSVESSTSGKLDVSSFASVSGDFLTNEDLINYYTKNETSGKEELANAFANIPAGDVDVNNYVQNNSATINEVNTTYQSNSGYYLTEVPTGYAVESAFEKNAENKITAYNGTAFLAGGEGGGGAISSYTTAWCSDVPPYGNEVINSLNEKFISAFISKSADNSKKSIEAERAKSANYAQAVNETYVENKGFTRNLSSEYGTISVIHNNIIESTNSAISRVGNEGFVSAFEGHSIGPGYTATYSWDKSLPNTIINLDMSWSKGEILTYSANTDLTGEIVLPTGVNTQTINIPNATEFKVWSNIWIGLNSATVSAADQFETTFGELAWASALPTYEYDNTNKISAINGSALAGGGDVPTGTMNVTGLGYNAVNEISAYNGSAIAQYGAEKQWLVHDDTLVHLSNSAQYALGCNVSALQRLMGIDETVLFTSSWNDKLWNVNLSEPVSSFKKIRMYVTRGDGANEPKSYEYETSLLPTYLTLEVDTVLTNEIYKYFTLCRLSGSTYTELSARLMSYPNSLVDWNNTNSWCHPIKIVGIGRKA